MDDSLKSPFPCYFFVHRCRFAFMVVLVPNRADFPFYSQSICIMPASCSDLLDVFCIASSLWVNRQLLFTIWESCFWIACLLSESDVWFIGFEMHLLKSILNHESSFDVKRGIRCDGLVWFLHRVRKSDAWSDNAYFILSKSDVVRLTYQAYDCPISALANPMPLGSMLSLSRIFCPILVWFANLLSLLIRFE